MDLYNLYAASNRIGLCDSFFVQYFWERRKQRREKGARREKAEEERQKAEQERQKADREKVAAVLSQKYDEVEAVHHSLKKELDHLKGKVVKDEFKEFHILQYMCDPDNKKRFEETAGEWIPGIPLKDNRGISSVISDVDEIMKFFLSSFVSSCSPVLMRHVRMISRKSLGKTLPPWLRQSFLW